MDSEITLYMWESFAVRDYQGEGHYIRMTDHISMFVKPRVYTPMMSLEFAPLPQRIETFRDDHPLEQAPR